LNILEIWKRIEIGLGFETQEASSYFRMGVMEDNFPSLGKVGSSDSLKRSKIGNDNTCLKS